MIYIIIYIMKSLIVAMSKNNGIGINNRLPWLLKPDLQQFKYLTSGQNVVMGRKTFESLPFKGGLPNRKNIVVTRDYYSFVKKHEKVIMDPSCSIMVCDNINSIRMIREPLWFIGGKAIYEYALRENLLNYLYITRIHKEYECDTFIDIDTSRYRMERRSATKEYNGIPYSFEVWTRDIL